MARTRMSDAARAGAPLLAGAGVPAAPSIASNVEDGARVHARITVNVSGIAGKVTVVTASNTGGFSDVTVNIESTAVVGMVSVYDGAPNAGENAEIQVAPGDARTIDVKGIAGGVFFAAQAVGAGATAASGAMPNLGDIAGVDVALGVAPNHVQAGPNLDDVVGMGVAPAGDANLGGVADMNVDFFANLAPLIT